VPLYCVAGPAGKSPQDIALAVRDANDLGAALQLTTFHVEGERAKRHGGDA
jgi:hypothetical protein